MLVSEFVWWFIDYCCCCCLFPVFPTRNAVVCWGALMFTQNKACDDLSLLFQRQWHRELLGDADVAQDL